MAKAKTGLAAIEARYRKELRAQRAKLVSELATVDARLKVLGKTATRTRRAPKRRRRARSGAPLKTYVANALAAIREPATVREIEQAVRKAGYKTRAKDLYNPIAAALAKSPDAKKVKRGTYALKPKRKAAPRRKAKKEKA